jgi:hypothetical protein
MTLEHRPELDESVHYVAHGTPVRQDNTQAFPSVCRAARVTEMADEGTPVGLCVTNPTGLFFHPLAVGGVPHSDSTLGGTWHYPTECPSARR